MNINDIAKEANVSRATVSRVINGNANVKEDKRKRVEQVIKKHNYIPNKAAASTKKNIKTFLILVTRLDSYSENRVIRGLLQDSNKDIDFIIFETKFSIEKTKRIIENNKIINGLIIFAISGESYSFLDNSLYPVVFIGQKVKTTHSCLYFSDYISLNLLLKNNKHINDKPLFVGYDKNDNTKMQRYLATENIYGKLNHVEIQGYESDNLNKISNLKVNKYNVFICSTEKIALLVYIQLLKNNVKDFKIFSSGYNKETNYLLSNFYSVDYHYKKSGEFIINKLSHNETFDIEFDYSFIHNK